MDDVYNDLSAKMKEWLGVYYSPVTVVLKIVVVIALATVIIKVGKFFIKRIFHKRRILGRGLNEKKIDTMATLTISIFRYSVYIISGIVILSDIFDLTSVLAAAGVGGIAIGLGAQNFIKDVIAGFFIVLEDQYVVGDRVTVGSMTGTVEELELRVTKLRSFDGDLYIIPNGEIKVVVNHTRGNKGVIVDIPLAYSSNIEKAVEIAGEVCGQVTGEFDTIVDPPKVLGIIELGRDGCLNLRIFGKTIPNAQWEVERRIRMLIKERFEKEGIEFYDRNKIVMSSALTGGDGRHA